MKKIILLLVIFILTGCSLEKEDCDIHTTKQILYISGSDSIKFEFEENYDKCIKGKEEYTKNHNSVITGFELINESAKKTFNNIDFVGKTMTEALNTYEEVAENNGRDISKVDIYTTSSEDYSSYLSYEVNTSIMTEEEIDIKFNKTIPYNKEFEIKIVVGMEYYLEYYEFINETEVKYHTLYKCYTECDENATYTYTTSYDASTNKMLVTINDNVYTYNFADNSFVYGDHVNEK